MLGSAVTVDQSVGTIASRTCHCISDSRRSSVGAWLLCDQLCAGVRLGSHAGVSSMVSRVEERVHYQKVMIVDTSYVSSVAMC